jgi:hypothetical protein
MGAADSCSLLFLRFESYVCLKDYVRRSISIPFRHFLGDVRSEFMHRLCVILHGTLGSYLRDALHEGGAAVVACIPTPRPWWAYVPLFSYFSSTLLVESR